MTLTEKLDFFEQNDPKPVKASKHKVYFYLIE